MSLKILFGAQRFWGSFEEEGCPHTVQVVVSSAQSGLQSTQLFRVSLESIHFCPSFAHFICPCGLLAVVSDVDWVFSTP